MGTRLKGGIKLLVAAIAVLGLVWFIMSARVNHERVQFLGALKEHEFSDTRTLLEAYYESLGPRAMLDLLEETYPLCHSEAHDLGKVVYEHVKDISSSIQVCANGCTGGCFHGVLMGAFAASPGSGPEQAEGSEEHIALRDLAPRLKDFCNNPAITALYRPGKCAHGVGHAVAYLADYHLDEAIQACEDFKNIGLEFYCTGGVAMQYDAENGEADMKTESLWHPCDTLKGATSACYSYKAKRILISTNDYDALALECAKLSGFARIGCFRGYGGQSSRELQAHPGRLAELCASGTNEDRKNCVEGAVERWADFGEELPLRACASIIDHGLQAACEQAIGRKAYNPDQDFSRFFKS